ncbi:RNA-binding domain-containing protein [Trametes cingulata]|nr:RNA-binding domain-containing protein [Trametes cingulata]
MSTLGKRKERENQDEGQEKPHGSTLFVSNLPYTATSTDLKTLFSDIAPVRTAFVVLEHGTGVSKGVGYVSFAIREDAAMAIDKISKEGITLDGRTLRVQWAGSKNKDHEHAEEPKKPANKQPAPRPAKPAGPSDPLAIRTVVISGLPASIDSKALWKKVRKIQGAEKVEWPVKAESGDEDRTTAHAVFETPAAANEAVSKLHAHVFKGSLLSATLKKRLDGLAKAAKKPKPSANASQSKPAPAPNRNSRLIVRNLPFDITEQDLRAIFLPYGPIYSVHIPLAEQKQEDVKQEEVKQEEGTSKPRPRIKGFAFVWFLSRKDAEKALENCNGMTVEAGVAEALISDKQKKKKQRREEKKRKALASGEAEEGEGSEDEDEREDRRRRVISVDWALSKDKWEAEKAKKETHQDEDEDVEMGSESEGSEESDNSDESDEESAESGSEDEQLGVHDGESDESDSDESHDGSSDEGSEDEEEQKPAKPTLPPPEVGTTLFIRNVPFEATEDELRTLFRAFGPLRYARITMDAVTGRSRGTGFVCFWNKEDADKAIEQSNILRAETLGNDPVVVKKNPFKMPSLLTPDPSASIAQNLVLHGRTLDVSRAVTRDEATRLKEIGERQREKADKRNLYLLREGIILPNTPAAELLPPAEVEKRTQSFNARRALLRSNPSLFVSRTRLSVRQLPLFVTERMLKRLAIHAVRAFEAEVKEGKREPLTADELAEPTPEGEGEGADVKMEEDEDEGSPKKGKKGKLLKGKKGGRPTGVKQAKIVRQQDRVDPVTGKGRSKGYGFVEMMTHADALRVLRWANNNLAVGKLFETWWRAELEDLIQAEKKKDAAKRDEQRIKRIRDELEKGVPPKSRGTLIVEFSIENIQVVQRRAAQQKGLKPGESAAKGAKGSREERGAKGGKEQKAARGDKKLQRRQSLPSVKSEDTDERPPKKKRRMSDPPKPSSASSPAKGEDKAGKKVGSLIGRKRKERKMKKTRGK